MMATGVVLFFMAVPVLLTPFISRMIRDTPPRRTSRALEDHVVIIGYDDTVRSILESLRVGDVPVVVVEEDEATAMQAYTRYRGDAHVSGATRASPRPRPRPRSPRPGTWSWSGASRRPRTRSSPSGTGPRPS